MDCIDQEVNIVPADLQYFVERNETTQDPQRAHFKDWEEGDYTGKLFVIPV